MAIAALADLTLVRRLQIAPALESESPAARRLVLLPGPAASGATGAASDALTASTKPLDVDRAVRLLRDLAPAIEAELVASGALVEGGQKGLLKKRTVLTARPEAVSWAQAQIRGAALERGAASRALVVVATTGMPTKRLHQLCGGALTAGLDPFDAFRVDSPAPDGQPLGHNGADLLTTLATVLAATSDTTNDFD
ncbi:MAG: hypothetical protein HZB15_13595 [Actinobacteria bacterium]|nr:hypothetical protein [Actinomycetota bacterium]